MGGEEYVHQPGGKIGQHPHADPLQRPEPFRDPEEDPLYDEQEDDETSEWAHGSLYSTGKHETDAVLTCPSCFTMVCSDCQRHAVYSSQYRAMFVHSCRVVMDEDAAELVLEDKEAARRGKEALSSSQQAFNNTEEKMRQLSLESPYHALRPVDCLECSCRLAVYDTVEEMYHFFNVNAGY